MTYPIGGSALGYGGMGQSPYAQQQAAFGAQLANQGLSGLGNLANQRMFIEDQLDALPSSTIFGELRGWRAWKVFLTPEGWRLKSLTMGTLWPSGRCGPNDCKQNSATVQSSFATGYYAYKVKEDLFLGLGHGYDVYGEVELYGGVLEYAKGYHAEYCRIVSLLPNPQASVMQPPPRLRGLAAWMARRERERDGHSPNKIGEDLFNHYLKENDDGPR